MKLTVYYTTNQFIPWYTEVVEVPDDVIPSNAELKARVQQLIEGVTVDGKQVTVKSVFMASLIDTDDSAVPIGQSTTYVRPDLRGQA